MYHMIFFILSILYSFFSTSLLLKGVSLAFIFVFLFLAIQDKNIKLSYNYAVEGSKNSYTLLFIFILLGVLSASWFNAGTIPALVYYGAKIVSIKYFYLSIFIVVSIFSFLLGSAFGTVGTIGLVMMSLAKGMGLDEILVAATIISGAYFGDRGSPTSSSANLVATITRTDIYENVKEMMKSVWAPYILTLLIYIVFYKIDNIDTLDYRQIEMIKNEFHISLYVFLPLIALILLCLFKINIKKGMLISSCLGIFLAIFYQHIDLVKILKSLISGYKDNPIPELDEILKGGGVLSMFTAIIMAYLSCSIIKMIEKSGILKKISEKIGKITKKSTIFLYTMVVSILTSMIGCSQATTILLTSQIVSNLYEKGGFKKKELAIDLENTSVVISPMIPWNISVSVPCMMLGVSAIKILPHCYFLILLPTVVYFFKKFDLIAKKY